MADQLPLLGQSELICLLSFTCNCVVSVRGGFIFLWVLGMGCVIFLWHSLSIPYNYFSNVVFLLNSVIILPLPFPCSVLGQGMEFDCTSSRSLFVYIICLSFEKQNTLCKMLTTLINCASCVLHRLAILLPGPSI